MLKYILIISISVILNQQTLFAANTSGGSDNDHALSASGGIASPSYSSAAFQNSAGLVYNTKNKFEMHASADSNMGSTRILPGLILGNGDAAFTAGVAHFFKAKANAFYYGGALGFQNRKYSIGVNGYNFISPLAAATVDVGFMFNPIDKTHLGLNVIGVSRGVDEIGVGVETPFSSSVQFITDATTDKKLSKFNFQPGIKAGDSDAGFTFSYGFGSKGSSQLTDGFTAGLHLMPGQTVSWEIYYRQLGYYFTSLSFAL